jgi:hypothetical protein
MSTVRADSPSRELIERYWNEVKDLYPHLTFEQFDQVVRSPFLYLKSRIRGYDFGPVRFKYFGRFEVRKGRAKLMDAKLDEVFSQERISEKEYAKLKEALKNYINQ